MAERYLDQLERVIGYIENSLDRQVSLEDLSREAGLSKYHLHHVFHAMTGFPLADYIRRRRLSESLTPLLGTQRPIIDIALDYGFGYEQSYIRAFKSCFGVSPGQCRTQHPLLPMTEKVTVDAIVATGKDSALLEPRLVAKPSCIVCGERHWIDRESNRRDNTIARLANDFMKNGIRRIQDPKYSHRYIGISWGGADIPRYAYIAGIELKGTPTHAVPEGMEFFTIGHKTYREFIQIVRAPPSRYRYEDFKTLFETIRGRWLPEHAGVYTEDWEMEYIDLAIVHEDYSEYRVLIPVS